MNTKTETSQYRQNKIKNSGSKLEKYRWTAIISALMGGLAIFDASSEPFLAALCAVISIWSGFAIFLGTMKIYHNANQSNNIRKGGATPDTQ